MEYQQQQDAVQIQQQQQPLRRPLPTAIAAAIATIRWPLLPNESEGISTGNGSSNGGAINSSSSSNTNNNAISPKIMYFEPLEKMALIRAAQGYRHSTTSAAIATTIASDIPGAIQSLCHNDNDECPDDNDNMSNNDKENLTKKKKKKEIHTSHDEYTARIAVALILLGHGYTDEAHDLVSPLSWPRETAFGYGPPVALLDIDNSSSGNGTGGHNINGSAVTAAASYAHALVHRREGPGASEFGMTGFQNADYWTGVRSGGEETSPFDAVQAAVAAVADRHGPEAVAWCAQAAGDSVDWEPRYLHALCAKVVASAGAAGADGTTPAAGASETPTAADVLGEFAQDAAAAELKVLLGHTLQLAGYDSAQCFLPTSSTREGAAGDSGSTMP
jgi:hypothetical protein